MTTQSKPFKPKVKIQSVLFYFPTFLFIMFLKAQVTFKIRQISYFLLVISLIKTHSLTS